MSQIKKLEKYCKEMLLEFVVQNSQLHLNEKIYQILDSETFLFGEDFKFLPNHLLKKDEDGFVYQFGGRWYLQEGEEVTMKELVYIDKAKQKLETKTFLGIHSGYEILNGVGLYKQWIDKAKFLGIETLGICEKNTLAGVMAFQNICLKNKIKPIVGMTLSVKKGSIIYDLKLYVKDFQGWLNLLDFNKIINVQEKCAVDEDYLSSHLDGLVVVLDPKSIQYDSIPTFGLYYQLDTAIFENEEVDKSYIDNLERFLQSKLQPILIVDAYCVEKRDWVVREALWAVAKKYELRTKNQYFKNNDQYAAELINMFKKEDSSWVEFYKTGLKNLIEVAESCNFLYDTGTRHLPKYIMTEEESAQFDSNEKLFIHLIKQGFQKKKLASPQKYIDRLKVEIEVLKMGDVVDYFLSLHDIIRFAKKEQMLTGIGRGSAGGSLVAYLLDIIKIDPIEFDLLFERFLNSGRMGEYQDRPAYEITLEDSSKVLLAEGSLIKINRDGKETVVFVQDLQEGDNYIKH